MVLISRNTVVDFLRAVSGANMQLNADQLSKNICHPTFHRPADTIAPFELDNTGLNLMMTTGCAILHRGKVLALVLRKIPRRALPPKDTPVPEAAGLAPEEDLPEVDLPPAAN